MIWNLILGLYFQVWLFPQPACMARTIEACIYIPTPTQEKIIDRVLSHWRVNYKLWCEGKFPCKKNSFDCSWLIMDAWRHVWYYTGRKLNSTAMYYAWEHVSYRDARRWDYLYFESFSEEPNHIAIVSRWWDGNSVEILDSKWRPWYITPREIKIRWGIYAAKFKMYTMRLDYNYWVAINRSTGRAYRYKK